MATTFPEKNSSSTSQEVSEVSATPSTPPPESQERAFFPWLEDEEHKDLTLSSKIVKRFPIRGAIGLIGSASTVLLSWLTLHFLNGHKVIDSGHLPKPAAWLSLILSLNSIMVQMAVSQGISVSWWYRASRQQTTVADLHNVWATGSSVVSAILSWRAFNFIALATVFVATLPINGILLQNAITSQATFMNITDYEIGFAITDNLPAGFSATLNGDGSVETYTANFQANIPYLVNNLDGFYTSTNKKNTCRGSCQERVKSIGFEATCVNYTVPFDLPLDNATLATASSVDIFSVNFVWSPSAPARILLNTLYKPTDSCVGAFIINNCTLDLGNVSYPISMEFNATGYGDYFWFLDLQQNDSYIPTTPVTPYVLSGPDKNTTTFGGIVEALASYYNGHVYLNPTVNDTNLVFVGQFAQSLTPSSMGYNDDGSPIVLPNKCNTTFPSFGWDPPFSDPTAYLLDSVRTTLFYTSILAADINGTSSAVQTFYGVSEVISENVYYVLWRYWGASFGVTFAIILFILPTYYGFWTLARKTSLSPLETARAFQAPVLREAQANVDTDTLLKEVGGKNLHSALQAAAVPAEKVQ